jgi:hypothetical protein
MHPRSPSFSGSLLLGAATSLLLFACGSSAESHPQSDATATPAAAADGSSGPRDAAPDATPATDAPPAADSWPAADAPPATDASAHDAAPTDTSNPACPTANRSLGFDGYTTRAQALPVPFACSMGVSGYLSAAEPSTGTPAPRWFTFVVDAPRAVDASLSCPSAYASFYYEDETTSEFFLWHLYHSSLAAVPLRAGRYSVKIEDDEHRYFGDPPYWEVVISWSDPPAGLDGGDGG